MAHRLSGTIVPEWTKTIASTWRTYEAYAYLPGPCVLKIAALNEMEFVDSGVQKYDLK